MALDKLVDSAQLDSDLGGIADAIRAKSGGSSSLSFPAGFVSEIESIVSGGGGEGNYAKKTGTFTLESNYTYANSAEGAYTGDILIDTGLLRVDAVLVWSEEWENGTTSANSFGMSLGFNNDIPTSDGIEVSPFSYYSGYSFIWNGSTRPNYGSQLQGVIFHNATNGVPEGKFGLRCHSGSFPILAGHTIHWVAWGVGDQDDLPLLNGLVYKNYASNGEPTEADFYGEPGRRGVAYFGYGNSQPVLLHLVDKPKNIGTAAFISAYVDLDVSTLSEVETAGESAFVVGAGNSNDLSGKTLSLPSFTGAGDGGSRFRSTNSKYYGSFYLPKMQTIKSYEWYQNAVAGLTVQIGSIGYPVNNISNAQRPFGGTTGSGTITVYTTGAMLDSVSVFFQNQAGANYTFIYKAAEATTYGGNSYAAGDTMLTA